MLPSQPRITHRTDSGFSLVELMVVLVILGLLVAFSIPAYQSYLSSQRLRGTTQQLASIARLSRERAMALGVDQNLHYFLNYGVDFHVHTGPPTYLVKFPPGVHYATGSVILITMKKDGMADPSGRVILENDKGIRDTMSVLSSGIVLLR